MGTHATIQVINESTVVTDEQLKPIIAALQIQVTRDFAPLWGADATLEQLPKGAKADSNKWWLTVLDTSDQAGALGYHDLTPEGMPVGKVFAKDDALDGQCLSVTMSHELLEMLGDPEICSLEMNSEGNVIYCKEAADAVEADRFAYEIDGVKVSDFQTLEWFSDSPHPKGTKFDFQGHCNKPFEVLSGGYIGFLDLNNVSAGFQEIVTDEKSAAALDKKQAGSRRERRKRLRETGLLVRSTAHAA